ncbi:MAG: hypothetical protein RDU83_08090 [bacterium]|nr:hypothetical protein [bacterium]
MSARVAEPTVRMLCEMIEGEAGALVGAGSGVPLAVGRLAGVGRDDYRYAALRGSTRRIRFIGQADEALHREG